MRIGQLVTAVGVTGAMVMLSACSGSNAAEDGKTLTIVAWGGEDQKAHVRATAEAWAEENGITIKQDSPTDYAKLRAQVESGKVSWGAVEVEPNFAHTACDNGWAEKLDSSIDTSLLKDVEVTECAVPVLEYAFTIGYNTDTFAHDHPTTWAEFFDVEKFPGKRGFWKYATGAMFEAALLADGVKPEELYPLDIERAFEKLDTIKDQIVFYETGEQQQQLVSSGEAPLIQAWNGRIFSAAQAGQPVANEWNEHLVSYDQWIIPKGSAQAEVAQEWLAHYVKDLEGQAEYANATAYAPVSEGAMEFVDPEVAKELPTAPENAAKMSTVVDYAYWAEHYDEVSKRLSEWAAQ
ncbi:ABC transporter substrate-binding protein [Blastococcus mobilis]|uniref:Putative spermidine/putrescine transport system substrate-binding protein n=1 Tax=Blastococcus mobilis TaxID=1938746 RepID=A0A238YF12_9ACTN|nr:ABC transporter substrate-binding protein [Blastococcus mobilis]SNR69331.1 putative spermidine/putrescine transport system substrate-binding protein [Blastococcus mobilis]